jgi:hypothetical protein
LQKKRGQQGGTGSWQTRDEMKFTIRQSCAPFLYSRHGCGEASALCPTSRRVSSQASRAAAGAKTYFGNPHCLVANTTRYLHDNAIQSRVLLFVDSGQIGHSASDCHSYFGLRRRFSIPLSSL